jgi:hypothetical protein
MSRVFDSNVCVASEATSGAIKAPQPVCLFKRVALSKGDSVSCSVEAREFVFVHDCVLFVVEVVVVHLINLLVCVTLE